MSDHPPIADMAQSTSKRASFRHSALQQIRDGSALNFKVRGEAINVMRF
jgi:hypothetical protein